MHFPARGQSGGGQFRAVWYNPGTQGPFTSMLCSPRSVALVWLEFEPQILILAGRWKQNMMKEVQKAPSHCPLRKVQKQPSNSSAYILLARHSYLAMFSCKGDEELPPLFCMTIYQVKLGSVITLGN